MIATRVDVKMRLRFNKFTQTCSHRELNESNHRKVSEKTHFRKKRENSAWRNFKDSRPKPTSRKWWKTILLYKKITLVFVFFPEQNFFLTVEKKKRRKKRTFLYPPGFPLSCELFCPTAPHLKFLFFLFYFGWRSSNTQPV